MPYGLEYFILLVWGAEQESLLILFYGLLFLVTTLRETGNEENQLTNIEKKEKNLKMFLTNLKMLITINTGTNKTGAEKIGNTFGDFIMTIFKIFAKFL
jgi:hypothetical protein